MPSISDVLLVRHGESEANVAGRFAYRTWDPPLSAHGRSQAQSLVELLEDVPVRHVVTSPLLRARETIGPLADARGLNPVILPDLAEVNLGEWDGLRLKELEQSDNPEFTAWRKDPELNPPPGGERISAVGQRVMAALTEFLDTHDPGLTVAATHADCLKAAMLHVLGASGPAARRLYCPNLGQLCLRYWGNARFSIMMAPIRWSRP